MADTERAPLETPPPLDEWAVPRNGAVPSLTFVAPAGCREAQEQPNSSTTPPATNGGLLLIFPGGGYRKVELEKEGCATARIFAAKGFVCCVADYQLSPFGTLSVRAATAAPSLADAIAALEFVQGNPASGVGRLYEASKVALCGFSAGGHLALLLLRELGRRATGQQPGAGAPEPEPEPELTTPSAPPVAALLLVYPTIRNPCCWCIAGGLW